MYIHIANEYSLTSILFTILLGNLNKSKFEINRNVKNTYEHKEPGLS